jgi:hypothetical protein
MFGTVRLWVGISALAALVACSGGGDTSSASGGPPAKPAPAATPAPPPPAPKPPSEFIGTWSLSDTAGGPLDVVILPTGAAISNWTEGEEGVKGEFGSWKEQDGKLVISYNSGWRDVIIKEAGSSAYRKQGFGPSQSIAGDPSETSGARKIEGPMAAFVGVWLGKNEQGRPLFYVALKSDHSARKSNNPEAVGSWTPVQGKPEAAIEWSDGTFNIIKQTPEGFLIEIWRDTAPRNEPPSASMSIAMVQEPPADTPKAPR